MITRFDLTDQRPGSSSFGAVVVAAIEERVTKKNDPYLSVELRNREGSVRTNIWQQQMGEWENVEAGDPIELEGHFEAGRNGYGPSLKITGIERLPDDHPITRELLEPNPLGRTELETRLAVYRSSIDRPEARRLLDLVLEHVGETYYESTAAVRYHHVEESGLLEHSIEVCASALCLEDIIRTEIPLDRSLLIVGCLLHDVGKTRTLSPQGLTLEGRIRDHISVGVEIVTTAVRESEAVEKGQILQEDVLHLLHIIESHHGQASWGSVVEPRSPEALLVHVADLASSQLRGMIDRALAGTPDRDGWVSGRYRSDSVWAPALVRDSDSSDVAPASEDDVPPHLEPIAKALSFMGGLR